MPGLLFRRFLASHSAALLLSLGLTASTALLGQSDLAVPESREITAVLVEDSAIVIDGDLNEPEWDQAEPAVGFVQAEPLAGRPASEPTEVRLLYDQTSLYVGVFCFDSEGEKGLVVNDMNRDFDSRGSDVFQVVFDTFGDHRNGFVFTTNPRGAKREMQTGSDGESFNRDWDAVWHVRARINDKGWQAEFAIPFKTLRFNRDDTQHWGINFERSIRRRNERSYWAPIPPQYRLYRVSLAGTLKGINGVRQGRNLYVKPYVSAPIIRRENDDVDFEPDVGFDVKYGLTSGLTLDLTVNTEFSQVEADDAQINFTRFDLFFPEKREFFLENQEVFEFGNTGRRGIGGRPGRPSRFRPRNDLIPFFSRRIGIVAIEDEEGEEEDTLAPILGGVRLTGRAGDYRMGIISMQTDGFGQVPSANFTIGRLKRDVLKNSDIGVILVNKHESEGYFNRTYGMDANLRFFNALDVSSYFLNSDTTGISGDTMAGFFRMAWRDRLIDAEATYVSIQDNYEAEVGFVPRTGIRKSSGEFSLTPRPEGRIPWVREFRPGIQIDYITDQDSALETRELQGRFSVEFNDTSEFSATHRVSFERLTEEDEVLDEILYPGDYQFDESSISFASNRSRMFSGFASWSTGELYNADRTSYSLGVGFSPNAQFGADIFWSHADLSFPADQTRPAREVVTDLVSTRLAYSFTTSMFLNALLQYSSQDGFIASNIRFNLIHRPLSDFYLVYNESRTPEGDVIDRALIAKLTYLFSF